MDRGWITSLSSLPAGSAASCSAVAGAYGGTAAACLREGERVEVIALATGTVTCAFSDLALMKARLAALPGTDIVAEDFLDTGARLTVRVPAQTVGALETLVTDISRGKALVDFD